MAAKAKFELECIVSGAASYAMYRSRVPFVKRLYVTNQSFSEVTDCRLVFRSEPEFLIQGFVKVAALPIKSTVEVDPGDITLSPYFLSGVSEVQKGKVILTLLSSDNKTLCESTVETTLLPFDTFGGTEYFPELLAAFVRPRAPGMAGVLSAAETVLKKWKMPTETGYEGADKNRVRSVGAAVFTAIQTLSVAREAQAKTDYTKPQPVRGAAEILEKKLANALDMALLFASCLEAARIHPVLALNRERVAVLFWLTDNCLSESVSDDITMLRKRIASGINDMAAVSVDSLFASGRLNFSGAEKQGGALIRELDFDTIVDVRRCRLGAVLSLPERIKTLHGYDMVGEHDTEIGEKPEELKLSKPLKVKSEATRERQWERRLLDLSLRNTLLNFKPSVNNLHLLSTDLPATVEAFGTGTEFAVSELPKDSAGTLKTAKPFGEAFTNAALRELVKLEFRNKRVRTFAEGKALATTLQGLYRKDRTMVEETGASALYLGCGFLKWKEKYNKYDEKFAPLILIPVSLQKREGSKGFTLKIRDEEIRVNTTLLEFLAQEFSVDIRGLGDIRAEEFSAADILATVKSAVLNMKGWEVTEDVYLSSFSFSRFLMWKDVRFQMEEFRQSKVIMSLIKGRSEFTAAETHLPAVDVDRDYTPDQILTPIPADSSQFEAIAASCTGKSFVLHGPPGTGKSQTITNIIANNLAQGRRVLFVAEKMAALSVVKKRLDDIGIGDFCLELHSNKAVKAEVADRLLKTLDLSAQSAGDKFRRMSENLAELKRQLNDEIEALHKKRLFGYSIYDAVIRYLAAKDAPDGMALESTFFDDLDAAGLEQVESLLTEMEAAAKECGGVYRSPFNDLKVTDYSPELRAQAVFSLKIYTEQLRHFRTLAEFCLEVLKSKVRMMTHAKIEQLVRLVRLLCQPDSPYVQLLGCENSAKALACLRQYNDLQKKRSQLKKEYEKDFKARVELPATAETLRKELKAGGDIRRERNLKALWKRLERAAKRKPDEASPARVLDLVLSLEECEREIYRLGGQIASVFTNGKPVDPEFVSRTADSLNDLYGTAEDLFSDYDFGRFNENCRELYVHFPEEIFSAFLRAAEEFDACERSLFGLLQAEGDYASLDQDYFDFMNAKAGALLENIDLLPAWCRFNATAKNLQKAGLSFAVEPLLEGRLTAENLVASFDKKLFGYFVETQVREEPLLEKFSGAVLEDKIEKLRLLSEEFEKLSRKEILFRLVSRLPKADTEGPLSLETVVLQRAAKSGMRGNTLRKLFTEIPNLMEVIAPCMLMSPVTVAQYIEPKAGMFDLVVFDEASQMPTSEAVGAIARGKNVIVVGDPRQLPPTSFFTADYTDEDNLENEDLESILEDCLALGLPEKYLIWHYRSRHESLIAFSNSMYYNNKLHTFPSPDALESKVTFRYVDGVYDRGGTKQNRKEAEALVAEVIERLKDPDKRKLSIGIVTFSTAQQSVVEDILNAQLAKNRLESAANAREEPIFVKNLENVQGDERDVILFSVGYGPDRAGRLSLNFGPLNQNAGWRRLNVAASRARAEMVVFSSMTSAMIDLGKTNAKGVSGLKAFLEFADKGRTMLAARAEDVRRTDKAIGYYLARELEAAGYECRYELGVSGFKIDCAVVDPRNKKQFILAVLCDGRTAYASKSAKDRTVLQVTTLKRLGWNVCRMWTLNFWNNPKREVKKLKDLLDKLTGRAAARRSGKATAKYGQAYKTARIRQELVSSDYLFEPENEKEISDRLKAIVEAEEPISKKLLIKRCLASCGILRSGARIQARMEEIAGKLLCKKETLDKTEFFRVTDEVKKREFFRFEDAKIRRAAGDLHPDEVLAAVRSVLEEKISLHISDLVTETAKVMGCKQTAELTARIRYAIRKGVSDAFLVRSLNDTVSLA